MAAGQRVAHLFEHLFFLDSENLDYGGLDHLMKWVGSLLRSRPERPLEKTLWAEADTLGFFINGNRRRLHHQVVDARATSSGQNIT